jgi:hypothetical protein
MSIFDQPANALGTGRQVVAASGTPVQLSTTALPCNWVVVTALSTNTNPVVLGGPTVVAAAGTRRGIGLAAGQSTPAIPVSDLSAVYIDAVTNGEGVSFTYGTPLS